MALEINRRYRLQRVLGRGGQGVVFEAIDRLQNGGRVALKVLTTSHFVAMLRGEFEKAKQLLHPNLARGYDFGVVTSVDENPDFDIGAYFFTQEFIRGTPSAIWGAGLMPNERICRVVAAGVDVARALSMIHGAGLIHRDVKPANILIEYETGLAKLIDLGLAVSNETAWGGQAGTEAFMSPETLRGFTQFSSDIFSLGMTLISIIGTQPRPRRDDIDTLDFGSYEKLKAVLYRMTDPNIARRYQRASDVVLALGKAVGTSVLGVTVSGPIDAATDAMPQAVRMAHARSPRLVGRDNVKRQLRSFLDAALASRREALKVAVVQGPSGVGKSRLVRDAVVSMQLHCSETREAPPQFLTGTLHQVLRMLSRDGRVGESLSGWLGMNGASPAMVGFGSSEMLIEEIVALFTKRLELSSILLIEGDGTLERQLAERLAKEPVDNALAFVFEMRDGRVADDRIVTLTLSPLDSESEAELLRLVLGTPLAHGVQKAVHRLSGGIPALTEMILFSLLSYGGPGKISASAVAKLAPDGRSDRLLGGAYNALDSDAQLLAGALAVAAIPLTESEALEMSGLSLNKLSTALETLGRIGAVTLDRDRVVIGDWMADAIRAQLSDEEIREFNRRAYRVLCDKNAPPWQCLFHAVYGGLRDEARQLGETAAAALKNVGDLGQSVRVLEMLLEESLGDVAQLRYELIRLYRLTGQYERAVEMAETVSQDERYAENVLLEKAIALRLSGNPDDAMVLLEKLSQSADGDLSVNALAQSARIELDRGNVDGAAARFETVTLDALRAAGGTPLNTVGLVSLYQGQTDRARMLFEMGLKDATAGGDLRGQARFSALLGMVYHAESNWQGAKTCYQNALDLATRSGDRHGAATFAVNLAAALTELGMLDDALTAYRDGLSSLNRFGRSDEIALAGANYAELLHRLGDLDGASDASKSALEQGRKSGHRPLAVALNVRGDVLRAKGEFALAGRLLGEAILLCETEKMRAEKGLTLLHLAALDLDQGNDIRAFERLSRVVISDLVSLGVELEYHRLNMVLAIRNRGSVADALTRLVRGLPTDIEDVRPQHLAGFVEAARGARRLGDLEKAEQYAALALQTISNIREKTPTFYHSSDSGVMRELETLLHFDANSRVFPRDVDEIAHWRRLVKINTRLNSEMRVSHLLDMVMDAAIEITGAERGFLLVVNGKGELKVRSARNMDRGALSKDNAHFSKTVALQAFESARPQLTTDALMDERFHDMHSVMHLNLRYIAAVPLLVNGVPTGTIYLDSRVEGHFDEVRLSQLEALADQAAIALTHARLQQEVRRRQSKIEKLNRALNNQLKDQAGELQKVKGELEKRTDELITRYRYNEIVAVSKPMSDLFRLLDRVVKGDFPVIVQGESGTGKELVARAVHYNSRRKRYPFVVENCAAIPDNLLESVLFGHVKGAFTGAVSDTYGLFAEAHKGTLFLDEIGDMPQSMQVKLLRVLQNGQMRPVGGSKTVEVDVRVVVATHADLKKKLKSGAFREDLFYRLNVFELHLPPLRNRREDIPLLVSHFLNKHGGRQFVTASAMEALVDFQWPGNVRQLENEILRAMVLGDEQIDLEHLSDEVVQGSSQVSNRVSDLDLNKQVERLKIELITAAMKQASGSQTAAAALLRISRFGLQKMLKRYGL